MAPPKILVLPGCVRSGSPNAKLAALAAKALALADAELTLISLADYPMPLYDAEPANGPPPNAVKLKRMMSAHTGVFIATPELNASIPPALKNAVDWTAAVRERGDPPGGIFGASVFAIASASTEPSGGFCALIALRQVLEIGCGALVLPEQLAVADAERAFDDMDELCDHDAAARLRSITGRLIEMAWRAK